MPNNINNHSRRRTISFSEVVDSNSASNPGRIRTSRIENRRMSSAYRERASLANRDSVYTNNNDHEIMSMNTDYNIGLTAREAEERLKKFGPNLLPELKLSRWRKFLNYFSDIVTLLIIVAIILSSIVGDWKSFGFILFVLVLNTSISVFIDAKAENSLSALKDKLSLQTKCKRDGVFDEIDSSLLVPGDIVALRIGNVVPADCVLLGVDINNNQVSEFRDFVFKVDESALTGESLPASKVEGERILSSSIVKQGQILAKVIKTGKATYIGRAAYLLQNTQNSNDKGHFQKVIGQIVRYLVYITTILSFMIGGILCLVYKKKYMEVAETVVVLIIAALPVGLPTVLSITMAIGASQLAKKKVIVKRLTAVEEFASVSILCSDKTGTLTLNQLSLDKPFLCKEYTEEDLMKYAFLSSEPQTNDPIEKIVRSGSRKLFENNSSIMDVENNEEHIKGYKVCSFLPFNPELKRTVATVLCEKTGETFKVTKGACPTVLELLDHPELEASKTVDEFALRGLRAIAVAKTSSKPNRAIDDEDRESLEMEEKEKWELIGIISFMDPPRPDSKETIKKCIENGIQVKMITGDQKIIAKEVAFRLGMQRTILDSDMLYTKNESGGEKNHSLESVSKRIQKCDGFSRVTPENKYQIIEHLQQTGKLIGMTGDGVNDAPALKKANVGIAVHDCTEAARSAADIVLLAPGLSTIIDGIKTSRIIFQRMRSFALYRISSTIHILLFFAAIVTLENWTMPSILLISITILNDIATVVIAFDNAKVNKRPDKWRIGQLMAISSVLAIFLTLASLGHYYVAQYVLKMKAEQIPTLMYLHLSSCPHFVIFSTRLETFFWKRLPSASFFIIIMSTQVIATLVSIIGVKSKVEKIDVTTALVVLGISLLYFFVLDCVKVFMYRIWSFKLTVVLCPTKARRTKLKHREMKLIQQKRTLHSLSKVRAVFNLVETINTFNVNRIKGTSLNEQTEPLQ